MTLYSASFNPFVHSLKYYDSWIPPSTRAQTNWTANLQSFTMNATEQYLSQFQYTQFYIFKINTDVDVFILGEIHLTAFEFFNTRSMKYRRHCHRRLASLHFVGFCFWVAAVTGVSVTTPKKKNKKEKQRSIDLLTSAKENAFSVMSLHCPQ